jgi:hypothetical protein
MLVRNLDAAVDGLRRRFSGDLVGPAADEGPR